MDVQARGLTEIIPKTLYAVGGSIPADDEQCCVPPSAGRHIGLQMYVLMGHEHAVLIDSGVKAFRPTIMSALSNILKPNMPVDVIMTRYNFDTIANLPWLRQILPLEHLYTSLLANFALSADTIMTFMDAFEEATSLANLESVSDLDPVYMAQDQDFNINAQDFRCARAPIRVLTTNWIYHRNTRTLFTSDAWGFATTPHERGVPEVISADAVLNSVLPDLGPTLDARFDWLMGAETSSIKQEVERFFADFPVQRLCPSFGAVIEGGDNVARVVTATLAHLDDMGNATHRDKIVGASPYPARIGRPGKRPSSGITWNEQAHD